MGWGWDWDARAGVQACSAMQCSAAQLCLDDGR